MKILNKIVADTFWLEEYPGLEKLGIIYLFHLKILKIFWLSAVLKTFYNIPTKIPKCPCPEGNPIILDFWVLLIIVQLSMKIPQ